MSTLNKFLMNISLILILIQFTLAGDTDLIKSKQPDKIQTLNPLKENKFSFSKLFEAFTTIFLSGLFDKSFFITAFMAVKYSKCLVFVSASLALSIVGAISVFLGLAVTKYVPAIWVDIFAVALFLFFGGKLLLEGLHMSKHKDLNKLEEEHHKLINAEEAANLILINSNSPHSHSLEEIKKTTEQISNEKSDFKVFLKVFILIFASEIGDRSQISTIYLTSNFNQFIVLASSVSSQIVLTVLAITSGVLISNKVTEKSLTIIAGLTFLAFGLVATYFMYVEHADLLMNASMVKGNSVLSGLIPDKSVIVH